MKGLVSIIIPVYNVETYLERCLESICRQTYCQLEVLLVNDGSTDASAAIARRYADSDSRFTLYNKENGGLSSARNYGIERADGEFIAFVDSDDYVDENYVEYLLNILEENEADIAVIASRKFWGNSAGYSRTEDQDRKSICFNGVEAIADMWYQKHVENSAWGKLYRRALFGEIRYPEGRLYEDLGTTYRLLYKARRVAWSSAELYYYFQREESIMNCRFSKKKLDRLTVSRELLAWTRTQCPQLEEAAVARMFISDIQVLREMPLGAEYEACWQEVWEEIRRWRGRVMRDREAKAINRLIALSTYGGTGCLKFLGKIYKMLERKSAAGRC